MPPVLKTCMNTQHWQAISCITRWGSVCARLNDEREQSRARASHVDGAARRDMPLSAVMAARCRAAATLQQLPGASRCEERASRDAGGGVPQLPSTFSDAVLAWRP